MNPKKIAALAHKSINHLSDKLRFLVWERDVKKWVPKMDLSHIQKNEIRKIFHHTPSTNNHSIAFYSAVNKEFSPLYIPDSVWYGYILPFYNPRNKAKTFASKVLFSRLLPLYGGGGI